MRLWCFALAQAGPATSACALATSERQVTEQQPQRTHAARSGIRPAAVRRQRSRAPHLIVDAERAARRDGHERQRLREPRAVQLPHKLGQLRVRAAAEYDLRLARRRQRRLHRVPPPAASPGPAARLAPTGLSAGTRNSDRSVPSSSTRAGGAAAAAAAAPAAERCCCGLRCASGPAVAACRPEGGRHARGAWGAAASMHAFERPLFPQLLKPSPCYAPSCSARRQQAWSHLASRLVTRLCPSPSVWLLLLHVLRLRRRHGVERAHPSRQAAASRCSGGGSEVAGLGAAPRGRHAMCKERHQGPDAVGVANMPPFPTADGCISQWVTTAEHRRPCASRCLRSSSARRSSSSHFRVAHMMLNVLPVPAAGHTAATQLRQG